MKGEFLLFELFLLACTVFLNWKYRLNVFTKYKKQLILTTIIAFFVHETVALLGFARTWFALINESTVGISFLPLNLEDVLIAILAPLFIITLWEVFNKK
ncbi:hypothetical protein HZA97_02930 [Candidatus Woesearchaeota archaeon]|nr:hypothetical protein [Candidatus Woesearchaeota archaeon]